MVWRSWEPSEEFKEIHSEILFITCLSFSPDFFFFLPDFLWWENLNAQKISSNWWFIICWSTCIYTCNYITCHFRFQMKYIVSKLFLWMKYIHWKSNEFHSKNVLKLLMDIFFGQSRWLYQNLWPNFFSLSSFLSLFEIEGDRKKEKGIKKEREREKKMIHPPA